MTEWFTERLHSGYGQTLSMDQILFRDKTDHQDLVIFQNSRFGRVLALDGVVQTTEGDEHVYHEMMAHVPIIAHGAVREVLIIGGGDGGMAREVLRHPGVERVTMVEIDAGVVEMSREHLPSLSKGAFDNPRLDLIIDDGCAFVKNTDRRFDVIIVDSTDPIGPGAVLFTREFYADCKNHLTDGGVIVTQNGVPAVQGDEVTCTFQRFKGLFADRWFYAAPVPTYQGGHMAFGWGTDNASLREQAPEVLHKRWAPLTLETGYYTPDVQAAAFALPAFILKLMHD